MVTVVKCPACAAPVPWTESSRWRPFCSERCKLVDLGQWASDGYVIPGDAPDPEEPGAVPPPPPPRSG
ncbi:MAG: DNA gyrase inhibitor YacG [Betaproteobacteria bacterium]